MTSRPDLKRWLGVTRVARLTGLDRAGVEVAAAIRPNGHVLQVTNGKGPSFETAAATALSEAAELWAAERVEIEKLRWDSEAGMRHTAAGGQVWGPRSVGSAGEVDLSEVCFADARFAWSHCQEMGSGQSVWLPTQALHCLPEEGVSLGPQVIRWTTNGMGAHPKRAAAIRHALLEAIERDQLARTLPDGWTESTVRRRRLTLDSTSPLAARWEQDLNARGLDIFWFDLTPAPTRGGVGLPVAGALLWDREQGPIPLTAGYACATESEQARSARCERRRSRDSPTPMERGRM